MALWGEIPEAEHVRYIIARPLRLRISIQDSIGALLSTIPSFCASVYAVKMAQKQECVSPGESNSDIGGLGVIITPYSQANQLVDANKVI